jgi:hypothetical protein
MCPFYSFIFSITKDKPKNRVMFEISEVDWKVSFKTFVYKKRVLNAHFMRLNNKKYGNSQ